MMPNKIETKNNFRQNKKKNHNLKRFNVLVESKTRGNDSTPPRDRSYKGTNRI